MISYEKARKLVLSNIKILSPEKVRIEDAIGRVLAENVFSPLEIPPFAKSAMDGYAVKAENTRQYQGVLRNIGVIQAGDTFRQKLGTGECAKIMTGAPLPSGADAVVMVEDTAACDRMITMKCSVKKGENVCRRGEDICRGERLLRNGQLLSAAEIALLATIGKHQVKVRKRPKVAIINTGGEIVSPGQKLGRNKIYNANGPMMVSLLRRYGIEPQYLGMVKDDPEQLVRVIQPGLCCDVLLISGGVSVGDYDFIPKVLKKLKVKGIFHKVRIKPGKPFFFGRKRSCCVFGLPGNPGSNFLAYFLFVSPALNKMQGIDFLGPEFKFGLLQQDFQHKKGRAHFGLVKIKKQNVDYTLDIVPSHGSADVASLAKADGFFIAAENQEVIKKNEKVRFFHWRE
ncbi:MAG: molybdopterin molybdotransferase MoeA [Elusimicrobia bacterium]|nr:molybdopterin molybdotransferase MoeA [Elusimicrobiota bacterium]